MSDDFMKRVLASIGNSDVRDDVIKRLAVCFERIKSIPKGRQDFVLYCIGAMWWDAYGLTSEALMSLLLLLNREKCTPPLPEDTIAWVARGIERRAKRKAGRLVSAIVCLTIPADKIDAAEEMIEALPYDFVYAVAPMDVLSPHMQTVLAEMQADTLACRIDMLCNDAVSDSEIGVPIDG